MKQDKRTVRRAELARQILTHAKQQSLEIGAHLREQTLADSLGVSRSPVRAALKLLEEHKAVINRPNVGYFLTKNPIDDPITGNAVTLSTDDLFYRALIDARLNGEIQDNITQTELQNRFEVPRTVVERVLTRLSEEGVLEQRLARGWRFLPSFDSNRSWHKSYQFRLTLEPASILLPQFAIDHEVLGKSRAEHEQLHEQTKSSDEPLAWALVVDADFHEMIAKFSNNTFFLHAIQLQNRLKRLSEVRLLNERSFISDLCREHLNIIEALESSDCDLAARRMRRHLKNGYKRAMKHDEQA